ncbi:DUF2125 domain-containing protein [Afifella pfennigii]|uniref:DUF2125 domain-containing protein n=1 Tax=Afifella pfennigii TaxID=209897 RepID=UPI00068C9108|nr:DUF2125 domain-containing protein [Afifella pfennigii]
MRRTGFTLIAVLLVLAGLWSAGWWALASYAEREVDAFLAGEASDEVAISCPNRRIGGYPFRLTLACEGPVRLVSTDLEAEAPALLAVARAERPSEVETALQSPLTLSAPFLAAPLTLTWQEARLATGLREPRFKLRLVEATAGQGSLTASARSGFGQVSAAESGEETALDLAMSGLRITQGELALPASDVIVKARLAGPPQALLAGVPHWRQAGLEARDLQAEWRLDGARILAEGPLRVDANGILSGRLAVTVTGVDAIAKRVEGLPDGLREPMQLVLAAIGGLGVPVTVEGAPARQLTVSLENGAARIAFLNLGRVPPLY